MSKTVQESKLQEWRGLDRISSIVHEMKCIYREISKDDFGIDGEIEVVTPKTTGKGYETKGGVVKFQAKAGSRYIRADKTATFSAACELSDLNYWTTSSFPILFIIYHPKDDKLYWKEIKKYVNETMNIFHKPHQIKFDKQTDEFTVEAYEAICKIAGQNVSRITFTQKEKLYSNLFPITKLPQHIWCSPTDYKTRKEVIELTEMRTPPFVVSSGNLYSLADLSAKKCALAPFVDRENVSEEQQEQFVQEQDSRRLYVNLLNQLFGKYLGSCGLRYNPKYKKNYFPRKNETDTEFLQTWYNIRTNRKAPPRTVTRQYEYGTDVFWRHLALQTGFRQFGQSWYLQLIPKYYFTTDGENPWQSDKVGPYTTSQLSHEYNPQVLNHLLFWSYVLSKGGSSIDVKLDNKKILVIQREPIVGIADFGILKDPAIYEEPNYPTQLSLIEEGKDDEDEDGNDY